MKRIALIIMVFSLAGPLRAASYSVFRVCQDQHVIRTSDGAEAGRVEYILVDPEQQRIVSTVITGGVIGERHIAVPYSDVEFSGERDIVLTNIDRERIVSAPEIQVNQFTSSTVIEPSIVEPSVTYFGGNASSTTINRTTNAETSPRAESANTATSANQPATAEQNANRERNAQHSTRDTAGSMNQEAPSNARMSDVDSEDRDTNRPRMGSSGGSNGSGTRHQNPQSNRHQSPHRPTKAENSPATKATPGTSSRSDESSRSGNSEHKPSASSMRDPSAPRSNSGADENAGSQSARQHPPTEDSNGSETQTRPHSQSRKSTDETAPNSGSKSSATSADSSAQKSAGSDTGSERPQKSTETP